MTLGNESGQSEEQFEAHVWVGAPGVECQQSGGYLSLKLKGEVGQAIQAWWHQGCLGDREAGYVP